MTQHDNEKRATPRASRQLNNQQLTAVGVPIVHATVRRMVRRFRGHFEESELLSLGMDTLATALIKFDHERGSFEPFLAQRLNWRMLSAARKHARRHRKARRKSAAAQPPVCLESHGETTRRCSESTASVAVPLSMLPVGDTVWLSTSLICDEEANPEHWAIRRCTRRALQHALADLPPRPRQLLIRHYFGGERFDLMAREMGISKSSASRMHKAATRALARSLRELRPEPD